MKCQYQAVKRTLDESGKKFDLEHEEVYSAIYEKYKKDKLRVDGIEMKIITTSKENVQWTLSFRLKV